MSDENTGNEMDAPATKRDVYEIVHAEIGALEVRLEAKLGDAVHQMRSLVEELWSKVLAHFDPYTDLPRRMTDAEARLDALEQPQPPPRRARRRS